VLKAVARQRLHVNQDSLDFGDGRPEGQALPILSTRCQHLWDALGTAYQVLRLDAACHPTWAKLVRTPFRALRRSRAVVG
jgi:hypothetical protein